MCCPRECSSNHNLALVIQPCWSWNLYFTLIPIVFEPSVYSPCGLTDHCDDKPLRVSRSSCLTDTHEPHAYLLSYTVGTATSVYHIPAEEILPASSSHHHQCLHCKYETATDGPLQRPEDLVELILFNHRCLESSAELATIGGTRRY